MVEEGRAAPDILTQTGATIAAIRAVEGMVVEDYLRERLDAAADASRADRDAILAELRSLMAGLG